MPPFIPSQIKIGNRTVPVVFEPNLMSGDQSVMGFYRIDDPAIFIDSNLSPLATVETFWHELMHAIFDFTRFNIDMQMEMDDSDSDAVDAFKIEERSAENFAKVFIQILQDNDIANIIT